MYISMKPSGIGGQAVIEGVMMRNQDDYAIAVRQPDNTITVKKDKFISKSEKYKLFKLPILRGMLNFIESLGMGVQVLTYSASFYEDEEEEQPSKVEKTFSNVFKDKAESVAMGLTVLTSIIMAVAIFILLPYFLAELIVRDIEGAAVLPLIEGILRITIFVAYIYLISKMEDIQRLFAYHGAEHKTINCIENGFELTVDNVRIQSREHKRCGTSFTFIVMFISIIFFMFIRVETVWLRVLLRLLLIPVISGVSYEFLKWLGRTDSMLVKILSKPGLLLQGFTTREPDDSMIEIAIASVDAVFDWRAFLADEEPAPIDEELVATDMKLSELNNTDEVSSGEQVKEANNKLNQDIAKADKLDKDVPVDNICDSVKFTNKYDKNDKVLQAVELLVKE